MRLMELHRNGELFFVNPLLLRQARSPQPPLQNPDARGSEVDFGDWTDGIPQIELCDESPEWVAAQWHDAMREASE